MEKGIICFWGKLIRHASKAYINAVVIGFKALKGRLIN